MNCSRPTPFLNKYTLRLPPALLALSGARIAISVGRTSRSQLLRSRPFGATATLNPQHPLRVVPPRNRNPTSGAHATPRQLPSNRCLHIRNKPLEETRIARSWSHAVISHIRERPFRRAAATELALASQDSQARHLSDHRTSWYPSSPA